MKPIPVSLVTVWFFFFFEICGIFCQRYASKLKISNDVSMILVFVGVVFGVVSCLAKLWESVNS